MNFEKNKTELSGFNLQVQKCGCTCNGGAEHSGDSEEDFENFNGEILTEMYS